MTGLVPVPTQDDALDALKAFLAVLLPAGTPVVRGQQNRVAEPQADDFVVMTPIAHRRLGTNYDTYADCSFVGSIRGTVLTVASLRNGRVAAGRTLMGPGIAPGSAVTAFLTGQGGPGTYGVTPAQTVASRVLSCGTKGLRQAVELTVQMDVHGPASADNAQVITTLFRDDFAAIWYGRAGYMAAGMGVIGAEDPRQVPFDDEAQQIEDRWVVDVTVQLNQTVAPPQDFADRVVVDTRSAEADFGTHRGPRP